MLLASLLACSSQGAKQKGEELARKHCGSCHVFPEPDLLPKHIWEENVLPRMGAYLGFASPFLEELEKKSLAEQYRIKQANVFPSHTLIDVEEWKAIQDFFVEHAPKRLQRSKAAAHIDTGQYIFSPRALQVPGMEPTISFVEVDPFQGGIWIADRKNNLMYIDKDAKVQSKYHTPSPIVSASFKTNGEHLFLAIGEIGPNDRGLGAMFPLSSLPYFDPYIDKLNRPVHMSDADLNGDGKNDLIICNYGHLTGSLAWYEQKTTFSYEEHILWPLPGATKTKVIDLDQDGKLDVVALMAQGDEGLFAFINSGNGNFRKKTLMRFPPVFGSSDFELVDMDKDGDFDIILTNGDNADYSFVSKPYHGLRIFLNNGNWEFQESFFEPVDGASKVLARDFDSDGDIDLALISFFPNFDKYPERGFLYFENRGNEEKFSFHISTLNEAKQGRWLVMDAGDVDRDGDEDLILGSFIFSTTPVAKEIQESWMEKPLHILILENQENP